MATKRDCFPVTEYLEDEMKERGWTYQDLAIAIGGDVKVNIIAFDLLRACIAGNEVKVELGDVAEDLARVFEGTHAQTWLNLHAAWQKCVIENGYQTQGTH